MHSICLLLLVICLGASCHAIRVDWGTNTGPIVPPPPRTTPTPPRLPYREPAPVWEDQSDDIPNPQPYVYVLPPPSRPRTWIIPAGPYAPPNYNNLPPKRGNYGELLTPYSSPADAVAGTVAVPGLAAQYVPGVGIKYTAIVPSKQQGKYNAKTKKYKAYEKAKYAPWNYLQLLPVEEKPLDWQAPEELPPQSLSSSTTTAEPSSSSSSSSSPTATNSETTTLATSSTTTATATSTTTSTTTTTTPKPTATAKLAHEKSAYLKKHNKLKKLLEKMQAQNNSAQTMLISS
ncbi:uncharacterized protein LOC132792557 [Drosophila nasuta]|uniref:uncharacterized protein LOC132792557 n=1 Tax=Drosophila nasuta TaxID=42062 RepID=UPI00295E55F1|nr:uncharacterized protein LOC132792557 [Drosophila nasuta]